jgi:hypothetical protein
MNPHEEARIALEKLSGLRMLKDQGMHVRRAEVKILNRLSDEALPLVAVELARLNSNY